MEHRKEKRSSTPVLTAVFFAGSTLLLFVSVLLVRRLMGNPDRAYLLLWYALPAILILPLLLRNERLVTAFLGVLLSVLSVFLMRWIIGCFQDGFHFEPTNWAILWTACGAAFLGMLLKCLSRGSRLRRALWFVPSVPYFLCAGAELIETGIIMYREADVFFIFRDFGYLLSILSVFSFGVAFLFLGKWIKEG